MKIQDIFKLSINQIILLLASKNIIKMTDKSFLKLTYKEKMKQQLNIENPQTFNEKLQWLKLYDRKDIYTDIVDKCKVKGYVAEIIGEEYIIPTLGVYNNFNEIDFDKLPNQFVIKCTHDSGGLIIVKDKSKLDIKQTRKKINKCLKRNFYYYGREWPYKNVKPRIIVEKILNLNEGKKELVDYKFWCFNGKPKLCLICTDRQINLKETFYDMDWNLLNLKRPNHDIDETIEKPINFELMKELSQKLSKDISFVRVDFYEVNGRVYFGELTFYPASGFNRFEPEKWDYILGNMLDIERNSNEKI